jgi:hypothetical protein
MTTLLLIWGIGATGFALYYRADAIWWKRQAKDCHRLIERSIPPASVPEGLRPFEKAKLPDRRTCA